MTKAFYSETEAAVGSVMSAASCIFHVGNLIERHIVFTSGLYGGNIHNPPVWLIARDRLLFQVFSPVCGFIIIMISV